MTIIDIATNGLTIIINVGTDNICLVTIISLIDSIHKQIICKSYLYAINS